MDLNTLRKNAREKFGGACRVCPVCNGVACVGEVPGMGGIGTGTSFQNNVAALNEYKLNLRTVHTVSQPITATRILGIDLALPLVGAAIGGIAFNMNGAMTEEDYDLAVTTGCHNAGIICMTGDGPKPEFFECGLKATKANQGWGIPIIKPRETDKIIELAKRAAATGALAFGVDIDAAALINMTSLGQPVGPKSVEELAQIKKQTDIPFIVKGIMTSDDALKCCKAGADAIVVSNHGGRALDHTPGTAEVLPYIAEEVKGKISILVDGGVRSGTDVLKMLALGADAVVVGRPLAIAAVGGGAEGVELVVNKFAAELRTAMLLTGTADIKSITEDILW
jgi:isopentenyl diphosphate isomerase/L-lactate dehydrogenase-like FMN-dependent dehydrogenase